MATDAQELRRKHRQSSSPEEVERSSKRHKHRHRHRHRHLHATGKYDQENKCDAETVDTAHSSNPHPDFFPNDNQPEDDVEEGEILEEDGFPGRSGEIGKKQTESDAESGEIQVTGDRDVQSDEENLVCIDRIFGFVVYCCISFVAEEVEDIGIKLKRKITGFPICVDLFEDFKFFPVPNVGNFNASLFISVTNKSAAVVVFSDFIINFFYS